MVVCPSRLLMTASSGYRQDGSDKQKAPALTGAWHPEGYRLNDTTSHNPEGITTMNAISIFAALIALGYLFATYVLPLIDAALGCVLCM